MFLIYDIVIYLFVLLILNNRKLRVLDIVNVIFWIFLMLPLFFISLKVVQILYSITTLSIISSFYMRNISKGVNLAFLFLFTSIMSLLIVPPLSPLMYFELSDFHYISVIFYILIKYTLMLPLLLVMTDKNIFGAKLGKILNRTSSGILLSLIYIYIVIELNYFESIHVDTTIYINYLFIFPLLLYGYTFVIIYHFNIQREQVELLHQEAELLLEDISIVLEKEQMQIIKTIRGFLDNNDMKSIQNITQDLLDENFSNNSQQLLNGIEDKNLVLLITSQIEKFPTIVFDIQINEYDFYQISTEEKYFIEMFGIIFDNAIQGALKTKDKIVRIIFNNNKISISNTFNNSDLTNFLTKKSNKGEEDRINGLKLLDYLNEKSSLFLISRVEDMITYEMMVIE